jgi:hypothetical protein
MKYLITKKGHGNQSYNSRPIIKFGKAIEITNNIIIINLINRDITKTMDFDKTTQGVFIAIMKDMLERMKLRIPHQR